MTIIVSACDWRQSNNKVVVSVNLKHTSPKAVDVVITKKYLKVSFVPFLFEVFLWGEIDSEESYFEVLPPLVEVTLKKLVEEEWKQLGLKLSKDEEKALRLLELDEYEKSQQKKKADKQASDTELNRFCISEQIEADEKRRQEYKRLQEKEKEFFFAKDDERSRHSSACSDDGARPTSEQEYDGDTEETSSMVTIKEDLYSRDTSASERPCNRNPTKSNKSVNKNSSYCPIRSGGTLKVSFTKRPFQTPQRESHAKEEEEYLKNSAQYHLTEQDKKLKELQDKALKLFSLGDFEGSCSAYSCAIEIAPCLASLYSNRAAAYLALNKNHQAIQDCTKALELLMPQTQENSKSRLLCLVRRGTASVRQHSLLRGLADYQAALKIDPDNEALQKDMDTIKSEFFSSTGTE